MIITWDSFLQTCCKIFSLQQSFFWRSHWAEKRKRFVVTQNEAAHTSQTLAHTDKKKKIEEPKAGEGKIYCVFAQLLAASHCSNVTVYRREYTHNFWPSLAYLAKEEGPFCSDRSLFLRESRQQPDCFTWLHPRSNIRKYVHWVGGELWK